MEIRTAELLVRLYLEHGKQQDETLAKIKIEFPDSDFEQAKGIVSKTIGSIYLDALYPLLKEHPSLKPDGLKI